MDVASPPWAPPNPQQGRVAWTRSWRVIAYDPSGKTGPRLYVALAPEYLIAAYEALFPRLEHEGIDHRHARSPEVLREMDSHPVWAGKAIVIENVPDRLAIELDGALAGRGLSGPSVLAGARPIGAQSGLLFRQQTTGDGPVEDRRQHLAKLLGD